MLAATTSSSGGIDPLSLAAIIAASIGSLAALSTVVIAYQSLRLARAERAKDRLDSILLIVNEISSLIGGPGRPSNLTNDLAQELSKQLMDALPGYWSQLPKCYELTHIVGMYEHTPSAEFPASNATPAVENRWGGLVGVSSGFD